MRRTSSGSRRRLRVVEQIVTDGGAQTASQIEALRDHKKIESRELLRMLAVELLVVVIGIVMLASVLKSGGRRSGSDSDHAARRKTCRLREEVKELKERVKVLERIATDRESTLERQIEELRDR